MDPLNSTFKIEQVIKTANIIVGYKQFLGLDIEKYFNGLDEIILYKCKETDYRYFGPEFIAGTGDFYEQLQQFNWYYQKDKWEFKITRPLLESGKLLEIGCGSGEFLQSLKIIEKLKLYGTEFNPQAISDGIKKGLNISNLDIKQIETNSYDYIIAFQVLEHIANANDFFTNCKRILKPNGKLIIGVPNCKSLVFMPFSSLYYYDGSLLLNLPPHHMGWWTKKSLKMMGKRHNFSFEKCYFEPLPEFRKPLVDRNLRILLKISFIHKIFRKFLYHYYEKLFKGETILVVYKKK